MYSDKPLDSAPNNISTTYFNLYNGALREGELQYALKPSPNGKSSSAESCGSTDTYKIGIWHNLDHFDD